MTHRSKIWFTTCLFLWQHMVIAVPANTVITTMNVGITPVGIAITPDSKYAYVANNNNYDIDSQDSVTVLDLTNNVPLLTINDASFDEPYTITINPAGTVAYVTNSNSTTITIIDIATNTVTGTITGFDGPSGMAITSDGLTGYVNNYGAGSPEDSGLATTVRVVDLTSNTITGAAITVGLAPAALAITSDNTHVYVINYVLGDSGDGSISVIDTTTNTVTHTITDASLFGPFAIAITADNAFAYVTNFGSNNFAPFGTTVSVVDLTTNVVTDVINLGIQPSGLDITPDGLYAYASNYNTLYAGASFTDLTAGQGTVNIIDIATNSVVSPTIAVGQSPSAVAISPNGQYAYVSNFISNTVTVIALQSFQIVATGTQLENNYLTKTELVNVLTWSASGLSLPISYSIYRDAALTDLADSLLATDPLVFIDHNRQANTTYNYYIVGANAVGTTSDPVVVTLPQA